MTVPGWMDVLPCTFSPHAQPRVGPTPGCTACASATHWPEPVDRPTNRLGFGHDGAAAADAVGATDAAPWGVAEPAGTSPLPSGMTGTMNGGPIGAVCLRCRYDA